LTLSLCRFWFDTCCTGSLGPTRRWGVVGCGIHQHWSCCCSCSHTVCWVCICFRHMLQFSRVLSCRALQRVLSTAYQLVAPQPSAVAWGMLPPKEFSACTHVDGSRLCAFLWPRLDAHLLIWLGARPLDFGTAGFAPMPPCAGSSFVLESHMSRWQCGCALGHLAWAA
jgi:hypothetical protein